MEDLPTSLLIQQEQARPRTGEELETFGKYAASLYLTGRCGTLSGAVVETVKSAELAPEQVRRVVEFTNTSAYLKKFASEGPGHKVVTFKGGPASFPDVIRDLNDGGGGSVFDKVASFGTSDYLLPPPDLAGLAEQNLARLGVVNSKLAAAFQTNDIPLPYEEPLRDVLDTKDKLAGLYDEATHELSGLETRYMDLCEMLFGQVKQAALEGTPLGHIVTVMSTVTDEPEFVKSAFYMLSERLVENEVFHSHAALADSLQKTAGAGMVNPSHPLVGIFGDYCDTLAKTAAYRQVREEVAFELDNLTTFIQKASSVASSIRGVAEQVPKAWSAATSATAKASQPISEFVSELGLPKAAPIVGNAVKYAPHIAAALAGEEMYQKAKNHPAGQAAKNFILGRVPYTHQNMIRQYNMQMGM